MVPSTLLLFCVAATALPLDPKPAVCPRPVPPIGSITADDIPVPAKGAGVQEMHCDLCKDAIVGAESFCRAGGNWDDFCKTNMLDMPDQCKYVKNTLDTMYCPKNPCDVLSFVTRFSTMAICHHYHFSCHYRTNITTTTTRTGMTSISCEMCQAIAGNANAWCKDTKATTLTDGDGFCSTMDKPEACDFVRERIESMFLPEPACDGIRCQVGNAAANLCNAPAIACVDPATGKPPIKVPPMHTPPPVPKFLVYKDGKLVFGGQVPRDSEVEQKALQLE